MNLYLISQTVNGYDTWDSAVVCAPDEETARNMDPNTGEPLDWVYRAKYFYTDWADKSSEVSVKFLGVASKELQQGSICSSFNAG